MEHDITEFTGQKLLDLIAEKWRLFSEHKFFIDEQEQFIVKKSTSANEIEVLFLFSSQNSYDLSKKDVSSSVTYEHYPQIKAFFLFNQLTDLSPSSEFYQRYVAIIIVEHIFGKIACLDDTRKVRHDITNFTGKRFEDDLLRLVEIEWEEDIVHEFLIKDKFYFTIKAAPTDSQPKNGIVTFPNMSLEQDNWRFFCALPWKDDENDLFSAVNEVIFTKQRKKYLNGQLANQVYSKSLAANVLMSFEIARREPCVNGIQPNGYPISREQTIEAIDIVMKSELDYPAQVNSVLHN